MHKAAPTVGAMALGLLGALSLVLISVAAPAPAVQLDGEARCGDARLTVVLSGVLVGDGQRALSVAPDFARAHRAHTETEGQWLQDLSGTTGATRLFDDGAHQVLVVAACPQGRCEEERALVAFEPSTGDYGATVHDGPIARQILDGRDPDLVVHPRAIRAALACATQAGF